MELARAVLRTAPHVLALCCVAAPAWAGDIYESHEGGVTRYATQKLDASYRLALRDTASPAAKEDPNDRGGAMQDVIRRASVRHGVPAELIAAVVSVESRFNGQAVSPRGARGAMQLMPETARSLGVPSTRIHDAEANIDAGTRHLKSLIERHHGNVALALAAYNAGEGAVGRHGRRIPPYRETLLYVPAVLARAGSLDR